VIATATHVLLVRHLALFIPRSSGILSLRSVTTRTTWTIGTKTTKMSRRTTKVVVVVVVVMANHSRNHPVVA